MRKLYFWVAKNTAKKDRKRKKETLVQSAFNNVLWKGPIFKKTTIQRRIDLVFQIRNLKRYDRILKSLQNILGPASFFIHKNLHQKECGFAP